MYESVSSGGGGEAEVELSQRGRESRKDSDPMRGLRLNYTIGRAALPYGVSVGRLHASDVLPRVRFNSAAAEQEEGLAFAEAFGVGISLHFKLGKLLLSLLFAASVLQLPALVLYTRHGVLLHGAVEVESDYGGEAAVLQVLDGAALARYSMAAVPAPFAVGESNAARRRDILVVSFFAACATLALLSGAAAARDFVRRDALALRTLAPRPEHYALLLRSVAPGATADAVRREVAEAVARHGTHGNNAHGIERVAVHYVLRPVLAKAVEAMGAETAAARAEKRSGESERRAKAARRTRARCARVRSELVDMARRGDRRAIAAFVVFESPRAAREASLALQQRHLGLRRAQSFKRHLSFRARAGLRPFGGASERAPLALESPKTALGDAKPTMGPAPADIIWENLEVSEASRVARRLLVRAATLAVITSGLFAVYYLRGRAIHEMGGGPPDDIAGAAPTAAPTSWNASSFWNATWNASSFAGDDDVLPPPPPSDPFHSAKNALAPYLTREPSAKRHALFLVLVVVRLGAGNKRAIQFNFNVGVLEAIHERKASTLWVRPER